MLKSGLSGLSDGLSDGTGLSGEAGLPNSEADGPVDVVFSGGEAGEPPFDVSWASGEVDFPRSGEAGSAGFAASGDGCWGEG
jgi:hypothetical protein